ncbi:unnamed protein product [Blepharisma stoltei]|uniref:ISXO2-like transposase domain-containing protein n=1 Tax=Blepharisma stoltei TaxID=1481888 RepID=A0AAU9JJW0_9CILI|nr:unnamed protein product [Blepharisma stoltei]
MNEDLSFCPFHRPLEDTCGGCLAFISSARKIKEEGDKLNKDVDHLKKLKKILKVKLANLEGTLYNLTKHTLIQEGQLPNSYVKKHALNEYLLKLPLPSNFFAILKDKELSMSFLLQVGAIESRRSCHCGRDMALILRDREEKYEFECYCGASESLIERTIWEPAHLTQENILLYIFLWAMNMRDKEIIHLLGISSYDAKYCDITLRKIISNYYIKNLPKFKGIVEIDESCFRSSNSSTSRNVKFGQNSPEKWVFGLYERESKRVYMEVVPKRTAQHLIPIIQKRCEVGTTIISDQWAAYNKLPEYGFPHFTVDHSRFFVNPHNREIHTQHIEISWCWAKYDIKRHHRHLNNMQDYLNVFCWKRQFKNSHKLSEVGDTMKALFEVLSEYQKEGKIMEKKIAEALLVE